MDIIFIIIIIDCIRFKIVRFDVVIVVN